MQDGLGDGPLNPRPSGGLVRGGGALLGVGLALWVGLQLGAVPYRYRHQFWQVQGLAVGLVLGWCAGRLTAPKR